MGAVGPWQIILVLVLAVLLFGGRGKISAIMGDFAKGIKSFRKGLEDEEKSIEDQASATMDADAESSRKKQDSKE